MRLLSRIRTLARVRPLPDQNLPEVAGSVAIILDGNGRWAKRRGLPTAAGHRAGAKTVRRIVEAAIDVGVHDLSVFAFSTENWSRPPDEVDALMEIFAETIERELPDLAEQGVRVRFIGRRDRAPETLQRRMAAMEDRTELNTRINLWVAFDYGGRAELVEATRRIVESGVDADEIDENVFAANLYAPELPDPICSSARAANCASRTSCSGSSPTRSWSSSTSSGRTSTSAICAPRWRTTRRAVEDSAADELILVSHRRRPRAGSHRARGRLPR